MQALDLLLLGKAGRTPNRHSLYQNHFPGKVVKFKVLSCAHAYWRSAEPAFSIEPLEAPGTAVPCGIMASGDSVAWVIIAPDVSVAGFIMASGVSVTCDIIVSGVGAAPVPKVAIIKEVRMIMADKI
jgi:hypothetical protein